MDKCIYCEITLGYTGGRYACVDCVPEEDYDPDDFNDDDDGQPDESQEWQDFDPDC